MEHKKLLVIPIALGIYYAIAMYLLFIGVI